jgi:hypothetical protein
MLSKLGSTQVVISHGVFVHDLVKPSIEEEAKPMAEQSSTDQLVTTIPTIGANWRDHSSGILPL